MPSNNEETPLFSSPPSVVDIERRQQQRLCCALSMTAVFFALVGVVAVWSAHLRAEARNFNRSSWQASLNLQKLNSGVQSQPEGCEATIVISRHCEKHGPFTTDEEGNEHCSYIGYQRAKYLATLFGNGEERWPAPAHLYALSPDRDGHWNFREWETLRPLSVKLGINVDITKHADLADELFDLLRSGSLCGQSVVISWKHEWIPELANNLGCGPDDGCPSFYPEDDFDQVWQLTYVYDSAEAKHDEEDINSFAGNSTRRFLKHTKAKKYHNGWNVYTVITKQNFDPLAYHKLAGPQGRYLESKEHDEI